MSKTDAMRALREARQAELRKAAPAPPARAVTGSLAPAREQRTVVTALPEPGDNQDVCGHRNMGGKSCTRPAGHEQANHRYKA